MVGGTVQFWFGREQDRTVTYEVAEVTEDRVAWRCVAGPDEWVGQLFTFDLEQAGSETVLRFTQTWREPVDFMGHCSTKWGYFLLGLKSSLEGGEGKSMDPEPPGPLRPSKRRGGARQQNGPYRLGHDGEGRTVSADRQHLTPSAIRKACVGE